MACREYSQFWHWVSQMLSFTDSSVQREPTPWVLFVTAYVFFPGAAVTNFYKPSAFKQHRCTVSQFWSLRIQNQGVSKAILSLKPIGEDPFSPLPQFLMTIGKSWHCLAYSYITFITASKIWLSSLCVSFYKDTSYSDLGTTLMTSSYLITSAKILFPNKVTFTATRN